ncbi:hypothetical protein GALMADRAFT_144484 [Galerina marginata CBS 339.88]|uniref:Uncharacterized protein n=1 Tax=Galerina marginata (strain CBS 339.88) TaxID=685588 RepID=A0A067SI54_GALM3|nr:hypothetical protein GALMADRAFT_144484 [Galerina marginata CBS 339.88]
MITTTYDSARRSSPRITLPASIYTRSPSSATPSGVAKPTKSTRGTVRAEPSRGISQGSASPTLAAAAAAAIPQPKLEEPNSSNKNLNDIIQKITHLLKSQPEPLTIPGVSLSVMDEIEKAGRQGLIPGYEGLRINYTHHNSSFTARQRPSLAHEILPPLLSRLDKDGMIKGVSLNTDGSGIPRLDQCSTATYTLQNGDRKEADESLVLKGPPSLFPAGSAMPTFPIIQFEVGVTQSDPSLSEDACQWIAGSEGAIKLVITFNFKIKERCITVQANDDHGVVKYDARFLIDITCSLWGLASVQLDSPDITPEMARQQPFVTPGGNRSEYWYIQDESPTDQALYSGKKQKPLHSCLYKVRRFDEHPIFVDGALVQPTKKVVIKYRHFLGNKPRALGLDPEATAMEIPYAVVVKLVNDHLKFHNNIKYEAAWKLALYHQVGVKRTHEPSDPADETSSDEESLFAKKMRLLAEDL